MSRYDLRWQIDTYTDDFGNTYDNLHVEHQFNSPELDAIYQVRQSSLCSPKKYFSPRYILATFADGRKLKYQIESEDKVVDVATLLKGAGAVCMDYVGEKWNVIFGSVVNQTLAYKTTPYTGLVASKSYQTGVFDYESALGINGLATMQLPFRVPANDNAELANCQKEGLENPVSGSGICAAKGLITSRFYIIKANALDADGHTGKVVRKARVSKKADLGTVAAAIDKCASCLGYQGESVKGLENLV